MKSGIQFIVASDNLFDAWNHRHGFIQLTVINEATKDPLGIVTIDLDEIAAIFKPQKE